MKFFGLLALTSFMMFNVQFFKSGNTPDLSLITLGNMAIAQNEEMPPDCGNGSIYVCGYFYGNPHMPAYSNGWIA